MKNIVLGRSQNEPAMKELVNHLPFELLLGPGWNSSDMQYVLLILLL